MRVKAFIERHRGDLARVIQHDLALRQIKVEGLAGGAGLHQRGIGGIKRAQDRVEQRRGLVIGLAVDGGLDLRVVQRGLGPHQAAHIAVRQLVAMGVNSHPHGQTGAIDMFVQGAQITRQDIGQHRHHAVGEIGGIAAPPCLTVKGAAGRDVMGDIGDGDPDDMAARIAGLIVGHGVNRIIAVTGIDGVNRDQGQITQILAPLQANGGGLVGLGDHRIGELVGDAVLVNGDQADRAGAGGITEPGNDARLRQAHAAVANGLALDQFPIARAVGRIAGDAPFLVLALVDGHNPPAFMAVAVNAQNLKRI